MGTGPGTFGPQEALADQFRLELVDRRGFGRTPPRVTGVDFDRDADDVLEVLTRGADGSDTPAAHLLGHSYGAVVSLVAAGREPSLVRSLTVIEPPAFGLARGTEAVDRTEERLRPLFPAPPGAEPAAWYASFLRGLGFALPADPTIPDEELADVRASMTERFPGEARPNLEAIREAGVPVLVVRGDWSAAGETARELAGAAFAAICGVVAAQTGGRVVVIAGAAHNPQLSRPERFNDELRAFIHEAERGRSGADPAGAAAG